MKCSCGAEIYPDQARCPVCGTPLDSNRVEPTAAQTGALGGEDASLEADPATEGHPPREGSAEPDEVATGAGTEEEEATAEADRTALEPHGMGSEAEEAARGVEGVTPEASTATEREGAAQPNGGIQELQSDGGSGRERGFRQCVNCGYLLAPDDPFCPVCKLRADAGTTMVVPGRQARRRLALPTVPRRAGLLGVALVAVIALSTLAAVSYGSLGSGQTQAAPQQPGAAQAVPVRSPQPISAQIGSGSPTVSPTPTVRATATRVPTPTATPNRAEARATVMEASVLAIPTIGADLVEPGSGWTGWMTMTGISQPGLSSTDQEKLAAMLRGAAYRPTGIAGDFTAASPEAGMATVTEVEAGAAEDQGPPSVVHAEVHLLGNPVQYNREGSRIVLGGEPKASGDMQFQGTIRAPQGRYIMEGTWKSTMAAILGPAPGELQVWEGTWTLTKPR